MSKVSLLTLLAASIASSQTPKIEDFHPAKVIAVGSESPYSYKFDIGGEGYVGSSLERLHITQGSQVKIAMAENKFIFVIDEDGKIQKITFGLQYLSPPPIVPAKK